MIRLSIVSFLSLLTTGLLAQTTVTLTAETTACPSPLNVYVFNGYSFDLEKTMDPTEAAGVFTTEITVDEPTFRYVGSAPDDAIPLIFGGEDAFTLTGRCKGLRKAVTAGSKLNAEYGLLKNKFQLHATRYSTLLREMQSNRNDDVILEEKMLEIAALDQEKRELVAEMKEKAPILGRVASLNTYTSYQHADKEKWQNEVDYYVNNYFQFVNFQDPGYNELPWTYEGNRNFANNLTQVIKGKQLAELLTNVYANWQGGSRAQFLAMSGGFAALAQRKHPAAVELAETIVQRFKEVYPTPVAGIAKQALAMRSFEVGGEAPTFTGPNPEGEMISLESLRGKVVLIDFWASWCGPCRRENPNVVRVYNEYKARGFEILGVSLDRTKDRWVKAIEADKLSWLHISDLKGWQSEFSRLYGVNSIPHTVLLDREGNIIARNLRGQALEAKLAEVFSVKK